MERNSRYAGSILALTLAVSACGHGNDSQDKLRQAIEAGRQQADAQAASNPAQQVHPGDDNPLRRKLSDLQILELFFGVSQTQGDWIAYLPCSEDRAGLRVAGPDRIYLKRCAALQRYLLNRAHANGFPDATVDNVMDPRISGARPRNT